jgi:hypothetical protein
MDLWAFLGSSPVICSVLFGGACREGSEIGVAAEFITPLHQTLFVSAPFDLETKLRGDKRRCVLGKAMATHVEACAPSCRCAPLVRSWLP